MLVVALLAGAAAFALTAGLIALMPRGRAYGHSALFWAVVVGSGAVGAIGSAAPTGLTVLDAVLRGFFVLGLGVVGSYARRRDVVVSATLAAAMSVRSPLQTLAFAGLGIAVAVYLTGRRYPLLTGIASGMVGLTVLHLRWPSASLAPSALALVAVLPVAASGYTRLRSRTRRRVRRVALGVLVVGAAFAVLGCMALLAARSDASSGVTEAREAINALRAGNQASASQHIEDAARHLSSASSTLDVRWAEPARAVPILAQQLNGARSMVDATRGLTTTGTHILAAVEPNQLRVEGGAIAVDKLAGIHDDLALAEGELTDAQSRLSKVHSPWLIAPLADRLHELQDRVTVARRDAHAATALSSTLPPMLGQTGPRHYFLGIQTPAEARASGGLIGNFAEVSADDGKLSLDRTGRDSDLDKFGNPLTRQLVAPPDYADRYGRFNPELTWENVTMSPDFPSVASVIENLYPQSGGEPVDGVITVDPSALAAILKVIGPVSVPGWPEPINATNAEHILLFDQYVQFDKPDRVDFLQGVTIAVWQRLSTGKIDLSKVGPVLAAAVRQKHIQVASARSDEERVLEDFGLAGAVPPVRGDYLGVVTQNAVGNKIDWFLRRRVDYRVSVNPSNGDVTGSIDVTLRNSAPNGGLPAYIIGSPLQPPPPTGTNRTYLSLYTPWNVRAATLGDGRLLVESEKELGRNVFSTYVDIPPGGTIVVHFDLHGTMPAGSASSYRLDVLHQPMVAADDLHVNIGVPKGWHLTADGKNLSTINQTLQQATDLSIDYPVGRS